MFLKRSQVLKNYEFPRSFAGNVIVKAKKSGIGFREDYPEELKNELAFEEFSDVIGRVTVLFNKLRSTKHVKMFTSRNESKKRESTIHLSKF